MSGVSSDARSEEGTATVSKKEMNRKQIVRALIRNALAVGLVLVVFALFHHALPRPAMAMTNIVASASPSASTSAAATTAAAVSATAAAPTPTPVPTPAPTAAPGDFSASFPAYDTGTDALYSYQGDELKVAINMVQENDITYYVADVWVKSIRAFNTAFAKGQYGTGIHQAPVKMAEANNAVFAVSGDYYGARNKGVVIRNGDLYRDSVNSDVCVLYFDGTMRTYAMADFNVMDSVNGDAWQAWSFGPRLLDESGAAITEFTDAIRGKNPRNAIGYYEPGHYCFITVDGRQNGYSVGMTLVELSETFASLGCKCAFNLDGGATAEMVFEGQLVNKPYKGGRQSSDIICF